MWRRKGVLFPYEVAAAFLHRGDGVEDEEHDKKSTKVQKNGSVTLFQTYQFTILETFPTDMIYQKIF